VAIVEHATDSVTILAKTESATGIVLAFSRPGESLIAGGSMTNPIVVERKKGMGVQKCVCRCLSLLICVGVAFSVVLILGKEFAVTACNLLGL
jgi:hypothetical protein